MATYIDGGVETFNAIAYGQPTQTDIQFFNNNYANFMQTQQYETDVNRRSFFQAIQNRIEQVDYNKLYDYLRTVGRRISGLWGSEDRITTLTKLVDIQFPPQNMIRWLMANPVVRQKYHAGMCEGYGDNYIDLDPKDIGEDHQDYRTIMNGMPQYSEEHGHDVCVTYDDIATDDFAGRLTFVDREDIIDTWRHTNYYMEEMKDDPTSQYSAML